MFTVQPAEHLVCLCTIKDGMTGISVFQQISAQVISKRISCEQEEQKYFKIRLLQPENLVSLTLLASTLLQ